MHLQPNIRLQEQLQQLSKVFLSFVFIVAILILTGWVFDIRIFKTPLPYLGASNPLSAILFFFCIISFLSIRRTEERRRFYLVGKGLALIVLSVGVVKLITLFVSPDFKIDSVLYFTKRESYVPVNRPSGLAPLTSVCFVLMGSALFCFNVHKKNKQFFFQYPVIMVHILAMFSLIGYLYHVRSAYDHKVYNPIAFYSSICFIFLSLAIMFANPWQGIMRQFTSIHAGSTTAQILIPTAFSIPIIFGVLLQYGSWFRLFPVEFSIVVFVLTIMVFLVAALWYNTILLNRRDVQKTMTEMALKESQEQVQAIFKNAPDAVIVINEEGRVIQWNRQAELIFGWTKQEVWYERFTGFIVPHRYREAYRQELQKFIKTGKSEMLDTALELKGLRKDNTEIDISLHISPTLLKGKYLFVGFIRDITEKKKTEQQLKQFNKLLEKQVKDKTTEITGIFERITDAFIALDKNFCYTYVNQKTCELIRRDPQFLLGKCVWDIFPDLVGSETYNAFHKAMKEQCYVVNVDYHEPLELWLENHIYPSPEGLSVFIKDISKRKKAEEEVKERAIQLHSISNSLPGIMTYQVIRERDGKMRFTHLSESVQQLTGKTPQEVINEPGILYDIIHEDDRIKFKKAEERSYDTMSIFNVVIRAKNYSNHTRWLHVRSVPRKLIDGKVIWDGVHIDITETMEKEKQLSEKEAQLRLFVENSPAAIAMLDLNMNYMVVSNRWKKDYDLGNRDLTGKNHYDLFPEIPDEWKNVHRRCLAGAIEKKNDDIFVRTDGKIEWIRWEIHPWYTISGEVGGIILLTEVVTERKEVELALKENEEKYRTLVEQASDGIFIANSEFRYIDVNTTWCKMLGYSKDELLNLRVQDIVVLTENDTKLRFKELKEGAALMQDRILRCKNGSTIHVEISSKFLPDGNFLAFVRDITERKKSEEIIRSSNERFEMIAGTTHDALWEWNIKENTMWSNEVHQKLYGLSSEDPVPSNEEWMQQIHPGDRDRIKKSFDKVMQSLENIWFEEYRFQTKNLGTRYIFDRSYIVRDESGKPIRMMGSMMDITNTKIAQKELTDYKYALDHSSIVSVTDQKGIIWYVNENFCEISKYTACELIGRDHRIVNSDFHPKTFIKDLWATIANGKIWRGELCNKAKDGSIYWVDSTIVPFLNDDGKPYQYVSIRSDITERKKAEELLKHSYDDIRRLASHLEEIREEERLTIAREIHDELGQQLTVLKMDVSWLNKNGVFADEKSKQKIADLLQMIDRTIKTVRRISSDLRPSVLDDLGLLAAFEWHSSEFEKRSGIKIKILSEVNQLNLDTNIKTALFRVFQESLTNIARHAQATEVSVLLREEDGNLFIKIKDNGIGFDVTTIGNKKTLGILGIKERMALIGGQYLITSCPDQGTTVEVGVLISSINEPIKSHDSYSHFR